MPEPRRRGPGKTHKAIKERIEQAFKTVNGKRNQGLIKLAKEHPAIFYGLVAKCIPQAVAIDVSHHIDLGALMLEAERNLQRLSQPNTIDVTPQVVEHDKAHVTVDQPVVVDCDVVQPGVRSVEVEVEGSNVEGVTGRGVTGQSVGVGACERISRRARKGEEGGGG